MVQSIYAKGATVLWTRLMIVVIVEMTCVMTVCISSGAKRVRRDAVTIVFSGKAHMRCTFVLDANPKRYLAVSMGVIDGYSSTIAIIVRVKVVKSVCVMSIEQHFAQSVKPS